MGTVPDVIFIAPALVLQWEPEADDYERKAFTMAEFDPIAYINEPRWQQVRLGLDRMRELFRRMGNPQDRLRFVHVAGTNGKGSTCAYIASALQVAGYRTGLFTSPYIIEFAERIRVNGQNIPYDDLRDITLFVREHAEAMAAESGEHPTEFELMTAVAFEHFARSACDIVVCEVGLGGSLDSTNVIEPPEVCAIVRIGLDHTELLGDTPAAIAREKAGIVKPGATVVSWPQDDAGAQAAIADAAKACGCELVVPNFDDMQVGVVAEDGVRPFVYGGAEFRTRLLASYQPYNAALAIEVLRALGRRGWNVSEQAIAEGVERASWPGRFEVVSTGKPTIIVDGGHNPQGAVALADSLRDVFPGRKVTFVMSVLADKDYRPMIREALPLANAFVCATPPNPRALNSLELAQVIREESGDPDLTIVPVSGFPSAIEEARRIAGSDGIICAFGSLYSIAEIKRALQEA